MSSSDMNGTILYLSWVDVIRYALKHCNFWLFAPILTPYTASFLLPQKMVIEKQLASIPSIAYTPEKHI